MTNYRRRHDDETQTLASTSFGASIVIADPKFMASPSFSFSPLSPFHNVFVILSFEELVFSVCLIWSGPLRFQLGIPHLRLFMTDLVY